MKYAANEDGETYNKFFGGAGAFKRIWPKTTRITQCEPAPLGPASWNFPEYQRFAPIAWYSGKFPDYFLGFL